MLHGMNLHIYSNLDERYLLRSFKYFYHTIIIGELQKLSQKTGESRLFLLFIFQSSVFSLYIYTSSKNQRTSTGYLIIYEGLQYFFFNLQFLIYIYILLAL